MQGLASTPAVPTATPLPLPPPTSHRDRTAYEAHRQQALQQAPASVAAASAAARLEHQQAVQWQQQLLVQQQAQFVAQQQVQQAQQTQQKALLQQARWLQQQQLVMERWQARAAEPSPVAPVMEDEEQSDGDDEWQPLRDQKQKQRREQQSQEAAAAAAERRQSRAARRAAETAEQKQQRREHNHALKQQYKQDWRAQQQQTDAQLQQHEQKYLEQFALAKRNAEQLPGREHYAFRPAEQITPTPQPLNPPPIKSPEPSSSPVPATGAELDGPSRERVLKTAKLAAMAGVLACGCDGFKMMVWVILQLGFRGYTVDFTQVQSFFDFVCVKPPWLAMLAYGVNRVYTGLQRALRFTVALCYKFVRSHSLTCCCHFRCNARHYGNTQLERDKFAHYRRRIRCSCEAHTHPPFRHYPCPFRDDAPLLNLHHIERTCSGETFKKLHDPKVTEEQFHAYLWSSNLICLCEGCHRLEHPELLVKGCKPDEA